MSDDKPESKEEWTIPESSWTSFWKHRNLRLIEDAPKDLFEATTPDRTVSDWNRLIASKEKCSYFINGEKLSDLRKNIPFESTEDMQSFLKNDLFKDQPEEQQQQLIAMMMAFGYQSGLFHATSSAVMQMVGKKNDNTTSNDQKIALGQPDMEIHLISEKNGLRIIEINRYRTWNDLSGKNKHTCAGDKEYYAKTQTIYKMTPEHIEMNDLLVDCPSRNLAHLFDERPDQEQRLRFPVLRELIASIIELLFGRAGFIDEKAPEAKHLYSKGPGASGG